VAGCFSLDANNLSPFKLKDVVQKSRNKTLSSYLLGVWMKTLNMSMQDAHVDPFKMSTQQYERKIGKDQIITIVTFFYYREREKIDNF